MNIEEDYIERIKRFNEEKVKCKKAYNNISLLRFIAIILCLFYGYSFIENGFSIFNLLGSILSLILFLYLLIQHNNISEKVKRLSSLILINEKYIKRIKGEWTEFKDCGDEYLDINHPYSGDLDIFGRKSLFQYINITKTFLGRERLVNLLKGSEKQVETILKRQGAVKEISSKGEFCQNLECEGSSKEADRKNPKHLLDEIENDTKLFKGNLIKIVTSVLPLVFIISLASLVIYRTTLLMYVFMVIFMIHICFNIYGYLRITSILNSVYKFKKDIGVYTGMLRLIEKEEFQCDYLKGLKEDLQIKDVEASNIIKKLDKIVDNINIRYNMLYVIINIILLWDYKCLFELEKFKENYGKLIKKWLYVIAEFESLSSLAVVIQLNPSYTFPTLSDDSLVLEAKDMGHPLIFEKGRVCNDVSMTNNIFIITGSNMSGKTTLLRTIGINLVLAYAGAPVCCKDFKCSIMNIFTSMRISDDLNEGISTFYAELKRIKIIIDNLNKKEPMIFFIDEIFRGTNSKDRVIGAKTVLKSLNKSWVIGGISTHDFELCDLAFDDASRIKNYHFSENYSNNKINFDYKLKKGRSNTTNAKYLMKMVGIDI